MQNSNKAKTEVSNFEFYEEAVSNLGNYEHKPCLILNFNHWIRLLGSFLISAVPYNTLIVF